MRGRTPDTVQLTLERKLQESTEELAEEQAQLSRMEAKLKLNSV